jgi:SAM-dependent methyltransferase
VNVPRSVDRQVKPRHYASGSYDSKHRLMSYWNQVQCVRSLNPERVLEIGVGNGFVARMLRSDGFDLRTVDLDPELRPDVSGRVQSLPFRPACFDVVVCCQVLEHIPWEDVPAAVTEIRRVARRGAVISLPDVTPSMRLIVPLPGIGEKQLILRRWWRRRPLNSTLPGQHYWELGMRHFPAERLRDLFHTSGFVVSRHYRLFDNPYHHFFELRSS